VGDPVLRRTGLDDPVAQRLIAALNAELSATYPEPGATHFRLDPAEVAEGNGAFLVARIGEEPAGCGAVRRARDGDFEIKRMYAAPPFRGRGVGRAVLAAVVVVARRLGGRRVVLETGVRQAAAIALYERAGYARIPPWGEYAGSSSTSVCMAKRI
jgi:putative acetyltransferase